MFTTRRLMGLIGALVLSAAIADAAPFTNGSFESASVDPGSGFLTLAPGSPAITGWEVFGSNSIDYIGTLWEADEGVRSVDLNGNIGPGGIRQTFDTVAGTAYEVLFAMAGNPAGLPVVKSRTCSTLPARLSPPWAGPTTRSCSLPARARVRHSGAGGAVVDGCRPARWRRQAPKPPHELETLQVSGRDARLLTLDRRKLLKGLERETGIEPATSSLGSSRSTAELLPLSELNSTRSGVGG